MESMRQSSVRQNVIEELVVGEAEKKAEKRQRAVQQKQQNKRSREHKLVATYLKRRFPETFNEDMVARMTPKEFSSVLRKVRIRKRLNWFCAVGSIATFVLGMYFSISLATSDKTLGTQNENATTVEKTDGKYEDAIRATAGINDASAKNEAIAIVARKAADNGDDKKALRIAAAISEQDNWHWTTIRNQTLTYLAKKSADKGDYKEALRAVNMMSDRTEINLKMKREISAYIIQKIVDNVR